MVPPLATAAADLVTTSAPRVSRAVQVPPSSVPAVTNPLTSTAPSRSSQPAKVRTTSAPPLPGSSAVGRDGAVGRDDADGAGASVATCSTGGGSVLTGVGVGAAVLTASPSDELVMPMRSART